MKHMDYYIISGNPHKTLKDPDRIYTFNFKEIGENLNKFNYNYDKDKNLITLVGKKPEKIAQLKFEDFDKGLVYKEAKDILDEYGFRQLPSEYVDKSIEKVYSKLEKVRKYLNDIKLKLKDRAMFKFNKKAGFDLTSPISDNPQPKTKELIEKHTILKTYAHNLTNLKMFKENIQSKTGQGILILTTLLNFLTDLNYSVVRFWLEIME